MSVHDSQRIAEALRDSGYEDAPDPGSADVLVLTTCSVREKARQKVLSAIGRWKRYCNRTPPPTIVVAGCVAQQEGQKLLDDISHVDVVVGPDHLWRVVELVEHARHDGERSCFVGFDAGDTPTFLPLGASGGRRASAYVTIQKGCDEGCAYCIVPSVRGPGRCRPATKIIEDVEKLAERGVREVILLGQTVNSYQEGETSFPELLRRVSRVNGIWRVRYESAHPRFLSDELIDVHLTVPEVCEHLHLPVQSGSDSVLRRMGRAHGRADFLEWIHRLRDKHPSVGVSSDLFVGFPSESEKDFEDTLTLLSEVRFDAVFSFKYSPRPGTPAAEQPDNIPLEVKIDRLRRLQDLQSNITSEYLRSLVGKDLEVLVEGESKAGGQLRGRSRRNTVVNVDLAVKDRELERERAERVGSLLVVTVTEAGGHSVRGEELPGRGVAQAPHGTFAA